jgi:polysaccharide export outer membrane protein
LSNRAAAYRNHLVALALLLSLQPSAFSLQLPNDYVLGSGDVIEIAVRNHEALNKQVVIMADGKIGYAPVGEVVAAGKTPAQLAAEIQAGLKTLKLATVVVSVVSANSQTVRVVGAIKLPGAYPFRRGSKVLDLVAIAGGLAGRPAQSKARLVRKDGRVVQVDVAEAMARAEGPANVAIEADDLIVVDVADPVRNKVYVMGRVTNPGSVELGDKGASLLSVLAEAGNPLEDAALTKCYVQRERERIPLNLLPVLVQGKADDAVTDFQFQAGDILFVPAIEGRFAVMGQVNKPGYFPLSETRTLTVLDAVTIAGGQGSTSDLRKAALVRLEQGKPTIVPIDLDRMIKRQEIEKNIPLKADDVLFVPQRGQRGLTLSDVVAPLSLIRVMTLGR